MDQESVRNRYKIAQLDSSRVDVLNVQRASIVAESGTTTLRNALGGRPALLFLSPTINVLYGGRLRDAVNDAGIAANQMQVVATGEKNKTIASVTAILETARRINLSRDGVFVAIGGGVLLDMIGFAASQFRRGVAHMKIGTTLVGQVDAAVGVKCGVNLGSSKNLVGSFYPPEAVFTDGAFLATLHEQEIRFGLAEMIKLGVIADVALFEALERDALQLLDPTSRDNARSRSLVDRSIVSMISELSRNVYEREFCRRVDFGHTISPQLESDTSYTVPHGAAVAIDIALFSVTSHVLGVLSEFDLNRVLGLLGRLGLRTWHELLERQEFIVHALKCTEDHRGQRLNMPLPTTIGSATFVKDRHDLPLNLVAEAVRVLRLQRRR